MAEDDVTPEQLAAIAAENEEPEPVNYKPPAQKSVKEIHDLDKDDESLRKYKETLLGPGVTCAGNTVSGWMSECWNGRTFIDPRNLSSICLILTLFQQPKEASPDSPLPWNNDFSKINCT